MVGSSQCSPGYAACAPFGHSSNRSKHRLPKSDKCYIFLTYFFILFINFFLLFTCLLFGFFVYLFVYISFLV